MSICDNVKLINMGGAFCDQSKYGCIFHHCGLQNKDAEKFAPVPTCKQWVSMKKDNNESHKIIEDLRRT